MGNIILFYIIRSYNVYSHSLNVYCISACVLLQMEDILKNLRAIGKYIINVLCLCTTCVYTKPSGVFIKLRIYSILHLCENII